MKKINGQLIGNKEFLDMLRERKAKEGLAIRQFAKLFRVSSAFLGKVLNGEYNPGNKIARKMGFKQVTAFAPIAEKGGANGATKKSKDKKAVSGRANAGNK